MLLSLTSESVKHNDSPIGGFLMEGNREPGEVDSSGQIRGCPRNCKRRASGAYATGKPGRQPEGVLTRKPGYLPP